MPTSFPVHFILAIFTWIFKDAVGIQNAKLILPSIVQAGSSANLLCLYDLEGAPLYSVQWYRGQFEFFRFVPNENPPTKVFLIPGLDVDILASNEHQVSLRNIPVQISGEFSCEITTDAPPFSTSCVSNNLTVVDLKLDLNVPRKQYKSGEIVVANCTLTPVLPSIKLIFTWNSKPIPEKFIDRHSPHSAFLYFNATTFDPNINSSVKVLLRCSAIIDDTFYIISRYTSLQLEPSDHTEASGAVKLQSAFVLSVFIYITMKI